MEDPEPPSVVDGPSLLWQPEKRRSRKSGCSNIFAGVNLRQLRRLFHVAGDRDAEQRARLVWGREERDRGREGGEEEERDEGEMDAGLAQALVGFRVRARSRSGIRTEGNREPKLLKAFGHLRIKEGLDHHEEDNEEEDPSDIGELDPLPGGSTSAEGGAPLDAQRPSERPHLERLGAATRQGGTKDPERYLHRILH